ncbi:MAG: solute carrier family 23 protein, partial [Clostridium sp.]
MILIGKEYGMAALFGSVIASGAVIFLLSFFMDRILKLFPQVVVGTFVTLIGITLAPTALRDLAGGEGNAGFGSVENLILGLAVLIFILLVEKYGKGIWKSMSLLLGITAGTAAG